MKKNVQSTAPCPCKSGVSYGECCQAFHQGKLPENALKLMRSRFSAYALHLPEYIIQTTHPASPQFEHDISKWSQKIASFCSNTEFENLEILQFQEKEPFATVTFVAHLKDRDNDLSFTEKSTFEKTKGKWFYRSGKLIEGHSPNLITTGQLRLLPLAYYGDPILHKVGEPIPHITSDIKNLVEEMIETMDACDGIGLAAPQIHHSIQLFIIRRPADVGDGKIELQEVKVFINPKLSAPSHETWEASEGCLSIPSIHETVKRPKEITVEYTNLLGERLKERVSGWEARVIMHEHDHIQGILFIDYLDERKRKALEPFLASLKNRIHNGFEL